MNHKLILGGLTAIIAFSLTPLAQAKKGSNNNQTNNNSSATNNNSSASNSNGNNKNKGGKVELLTVEVEQKTWLRPVGSTSTNGGEAEIQVRTLGTNSTSKVKLEPRVLAPDTYTVSAVRRSDSNTVVLGVFDSVAPVTNGVSGGTNFVDDKGLHSGTNESEIVFGTPAYPLPTGLNATDIALLILAGTGTNAPLVADFTDVTKLKDAQVKVSLPLKGLTATGKYTSEVQQKKGKSSVSAKLEASNLPANAVVTLVVNGSSVGSYAADKKGGLKIEGILTAAPTKGKSKGPQFPVGFNPLSVQTLGLTGAGGTNLLGGSIIIP
jgi:hypothetical protein